MIKYHGTPLSGTGDEATRFLFGRHALVSYANPQSMDLVAHVCQSFVLDNGAFSFWMNEEKAKAKGLPAPAPVNWDSFLAWVWEWHRHPRFDWWLIPDVITGSEDDNWGLIKEYGFALPNAVPVYHLHESLDHLKRLMSHFGRIALGSSGEWSTPGTQAWKQRMAEIMKVVCDSQGRPGIKLHGLRMLNPAVFRSIPLSSADSCNVAINCSDSMRWQGPYKPPRQSQRATVIAWRIEANNSADAWGNTWEEN